MSTLTKTLCKGSYMFKKYYLGTMTKKEILKLNPNQGENRMAKNSTTLTGFAKDIAEGKNIGSVIQLAADSKNIWIGDGGNRLLGEKIPGSTQFEVFLNMVNDTDDVLFIINRLNKVRNHSKGYQAYTDEVIRGLILPWENEFKVAGILLNKELPSRVTRSITYLQASRLILASKTGHAKDSDAALQKTSKTHMRRFFEHMRLFTTTSDFLTPEFQPMFRGYAALKGWAALLNITNNISGNELLKFFSKNADQIEELVRNKAPRIQYVLWQYICKMAIGCTDTAFEKEYIEKEVVIKHIKW